MFWKKKRKGEQPTSEVNVAKEEGGLYVVTVRGKMSDGLFKRLEAIGARELGAAGAAAAVKVLWNLEEFQGWTGAPGDGDIDFLLKYDSQIERIAAVGDPKWEENAMLFLGAGYRKAEVRFFSTDGMDAARRWLRE
jgi:hypothetical protein